MNPETESESQINLREMPYEVYSFDDIKMAWHSFAYEMKEQGKESIYSALKRRDPKITGDHTYLMEVDNQVMVDIISQILPDFNNFIRRRVKNYNVQINVSISEHTDDDIDVHLSGKDKFQKMARKNPSLHTFKNIFNLDIEY